jgi:hypothetical protein
MVMATVSLGWIWGPMNGLVVLFQLVTYITAAIVGHA